MAQSHSPGPLFLLSIQVNPEDQEDLLHPESKTKKCVKFRQRHQAWIVLMKPIILKYNEKWKGRMVVQSLLSLMLFKNASSLLLRVG